MKIIALSILFLLLSATITNLVYAQTPPRKIEDIVIPFTAVNAEFSTPEHFEFPSKHIANWILTIENNLQYNEQNPDAKVVLRLKENPEDKEFLEIMMFGPATYKFAISVANEAVGYMRVYENNRAWFPDRAATVSYVQNERLSVNNGQRTVTDKLGIPDFTLGTIEVYGRDDVDDDVNAISGQIKLEVLSGNPLDNPILIIPPIIAAITGGVIVMLLILKKR